jgi:integrase
VNYALRRAIGGDADIRYTDVQAWVAELSGELSPSMVATVYSVLARILDDAVSDRLLAVNVARGVKLPKRAPRHNVYLTAAQLDRLAKESGRYGSLVLLLGVGGLRWGEAVALRVSAGPALTPRGLRRSRPSTPAMSQVAVRPASTITPDSV